MTRWTSKHTGMVFGAYRHAELTSQLDTLELDDLQAAYNAMRPKPKVPAGEEEWQTIIDAAHRAKRARAPRHEGSA